MYATTSVGREVAVQEWSVTATSSAGGQPITAGVVKLAGGHAVAHIGLSSAGVWRFSFTLRLSDTDEETVYTDVRIS